VRGLSLLLWDKHRRRRGSSAHSEKKDIPTRKAVTGRHARVPAFGRSASSHCRVVVTFMKYADLPVISKHESANAINLFHGSSLLATEIQERVVPSMGGAPLFQGLG
jgi:hypothetical protein